MNISEHITYREATFSREAVKKGIFNEPDEVQLKAIQILAEAIFEPLRSGLEGKPIHISSLFRSAELNSLVGGSHNSQHLCNEGAAVDLDNDINGDPSNRDIFFYIKSDLLFDQLIWEYGDNESPSWVHVSYHEGHNRNQVLRCMNGDYILM